MRTNILAALVLTALALIAPSASAETRPESGANPIRLEGQIREIGADGDHIVIRLHRDKYPLLVGPSVRARWQNGKRIDVRDLQSGDSIRVDGDLRRDVIVVDRITVLRRIERR
jgi:hypothetical protein